MSPPTAVQPHSSTACCTVPAKGPRWKWAVLAILLLSSCTAWCEKVPLTENDLLSDIPITSLAAGIEQPVNHAPASITIITREMIAASGAINWTDIFRLVPGFQAYAPNANRFGIAYHGTGDELPNHLEVMVDGRSVYDPIQSSVMWGAIGIDFDDIDHIEIVRGSNAPAHGSNAFLGAVNIITRKPLQDTGTHIKVINGEQSTREAAIRHNNRWHAAAYRLSIAYRHNDGFKDSDAFGPDDGEEAMNFNLRTTITPNLNNTFDTDVGFSRQDTEFGYAQATQLYTPVRYYNQHQRLKWEHLISGGEDLQVQFYRNHFRASGSRNFGWSSTLIPEPFFSLLGIPDAPVVQGFHTMETERYDVEARYRYQRPGPVQWTAGIGARYESVDAPFFLDDQGKIDEQSFRLFSHGEWRPWSRTGINMGLMVEDSFAGTLTSPRLSINYDLHPYHTLRLSGAEGRRTPSITEANARITFALEDFILQDQLRTEDLDEEQITNIELAYVGYFPRWNLSFDIKVFREKIRDGLANYKEPVTELPTALFDPTRLVRDNTAEWDTTGAETQLSFRPNEQTYIRLHYAYLEVDSRFLDNMDPLSYADFNEGTPRHSGGILFNRQLGSGLSTGFTIYHQSEVMWRSGSFIDEFTRVDAQITYQFLAGSSLAKIQLIGQNLLEDYHEFNQENVFETRLLLKVTVDIP